MARRGKAGGARYVWVRHGTAWQGCQGVARHGTSGYCSAKLCRAWLAWRGLAREGLARVAAQVPARRCCLGPASPGSAKQGRQGLARKALPGTPRHCVAGRGCRGGSRQGRSRLVPARPCAAAHGWLGRHGRALHRPAGRWQGVAERGCRCKAGQLHCLAGPGIARLARQGPVRQGWARFGKA